MYPLNNSVFYVINGVVLQGEKINTLNVGTIITVTVLNSYNINRQGNVMLF